MHADNEYDIIVCGGGAAGCAVAGRLANLDPRLSVLVLEAGENNYNKERSVIIPGVFPRHIAEDSSTISTYRGYPSRCLYGRTPMVPCANILGGGSSINSMMYTRGSASDFDNWQMNGWFYKDLLPCIRKIETYQHRCTNQDVHGFDGPVKVSAGNYQYPYIDEFMAAVESQGIPFLEDCQNFKTGHGAQHWLKWIDRETGRRSDAAHAYIHPTMRHKSNLHLRCNMKVDRLIVENDRAVAVEVVPARPVQVGKTHRVRYIARKQIVLSSGTLSSPLILQRSGIGSPSKLLAAGIVPKVALPGVGLNYQDHALTSAPYRFKSQCHTFDDFIRGVPDVQDAAFERWFSRGTGPLASNGMDCGTKIRPTAEEITFLTDQYPSFRENWEKYYANTPDKPLIHYALICGWYGDHTLMPHNGRFFTMFSFMEYPYSRGHIGIKSGDPYEMPDFNSALLSDERDLAPMVFGYIKARETARRLQSYSGEVTHGHPHFDFDSECATRDFPFSELKQLAGERNLSAGIRHGNWVVPRCTDRLQNGDVLNTNRNANCLRKSLEYTKGDLNAVEDWVRRHVETTWHGVGTCSMAPKDGNENAPGGGVVDERLNVYGVEGLKIADLSIAPTNVGCNTYSTALTIGEKAAVLIAEDLGYLGSSLDMKIPRGDDNSV